MAAHATGEAWFIPGREFGGIRLIDFSVDTLE